MYPAETFRKQIGKTSQKLLMTARIKLTTENYERFANLLVKTAKKYIPREFRKMHIPRWNKHSEDIYQQFKKSESDELADKLIE